MMRKKHAKIKRKCIPSRFVEAKFLCVKQSQSWAQISFLYIREDDMLVVMKKKYSAYKKYKRSRVIYIHDW